MSKKTIIIIAVVGLVLWLMFHFASNASNAAVASATSGQNPGLTE